MGAQGPLYLLYDVRMLRKYAVTIIKISFIFQVTIEKKNEIYKRISKISCWSIGSTAYSSWRAVGAARVRRSFFSYMIGFALINPDTILAKSCNLLGKGNNKTDVVLT